MIVWPCEPDIDYYGFAPTYFLACTTQAMSSSEQFTHGGPLLATSHRTFRVRHERHARAARRRRLVVVVVVVAVVLQGGAVEPARGLVGLAGEVADVDGSRTVADIDGRQVSLNIRSLVIGLCVGWLQVWLWIPGVSIR